jgi:hypothetical protein
MEPDMQNELAEQEKEQEIEVVAEEEENVSRETSEEPEEQEQDDEAPKGDDEELEQYSKSVQKRISKITNKYREEESARKSAVDYAEAIKKQNDELKARLEKLDQSYVGEFGSRIESEVSTAKEEYRKAYEDGDPDAMFTAQQKISRLALEEANYNQAKQRQAEQAEQAAAEPQQAVTQQAPAQKQAPDPKAEAWAGKNEWFGTDQTMTYAAFGIHKQLIEDEGFDPTSDEYYSELDRRVRTEFPQKFKGAKKDSGPRVASAESTASKSSSKGRRTVKLTPSQIAIAKRLNVPLEEYAKYVKE